MTRIVIKINKIKKRKDEDVVKLHECQLNKIKKLINMEVVK